MDKYIDIAKIISKEEMLRFFLIALFLFIIYETLVKKPLKEAIEKITTFSSKMDDVGEIKKISSLCEKMDTAMTSMKEHFDSKIEIITSVLNNVLYNELTEKVSKAKMMGGKTHKQDETFRAKWDKYLALGDGNGDGLLQDWNSLSWLTEDEYFDKIKKIKET